MQKFLTIFSTTVLFTVLMVSCGGGGGSSAPTPDPIDSPDPPIVIDDPSTPPTSEKETFTWNDPAPWSGIPGDPVKFYSYEITIDPSAYRDSSSVTLANELVEVKKQSSELVNFDREAATETATAIAQHLWDNMLTGVPDDFVDPATGSWNGWGLDSDDAIIVREVQALIWYGLISYAELFDTTLAATIRSEASTQMASGGYLYDLYEYCVITNGDGPTGDDLTTEDRMLGIEIACFSKMANVLNVPSYDLMAQAAMQEISDEMTGSQMFSYLLTPAGGDLGSLALWNAAFYVRAAALTYHEDWADSMLASINTNRAGWENVDYMGFDYTNLGWSALSGAIAQLDNYYDLAALANAPIPQDYYDEATDRLFATTDDPYGGTDYFRHRSYGYCGFVQDALLWDSSQFTAHGLWSMADCDKFVGLGTNQAILGAADGMLEWWISNVLPYSTSFDLDKDGDTDEGVVFPNYRGLITVGSPYSHQLCGSTLTGIVLASEQFKKYPNIPTE